MITLNSFQDDVKEAWVVDLWDDPMIIFCWKLKLVKKVLVDLNKKNGNVHSKVVDFKTKLHNIQHSLGSDTFNHELLSQEQIAILELNKASEEEELLLHQKSRVNGLRLGDKNNSFFFNQVKSN